MTVPAIAVTAYSRESISTRPGTARPAALASVMLVSAGTAATVVAVLKTLPPVAGSAISFSVAPTIGRMRALRPVPASVPSALTSLPPQSPTDLARTVNCGFGCAAATAWRGSSAMKSRPALSSWPTGLSSVSTSVPWYPVI